MSRRRPTTMVAVLIPAAAISLGVSRTHRLPLSRAAAGHVTSVSASLPDITDHRLSAPGLFTPMEMALAEKTAAIGWVIECVDTGGDDVVGLQTSLAVDPRGYPHISYFDDTNDALKYAYRDAWAWHTDTVATGLGSRGGYTSLALDLEGFPHITYHDYSDTDLKYAYQDASGWHVERVDGTDTYVNGYYNSLALDDGGQPHISYSHAYDDYDLKHAYRDASGWHRQTVAILGRVGLFSSLALDEDGYAHISCWHFTDNFNSSLDYAYQDAGGWHVVLGVDSGQVGRYTSLALDSAGCPHISYHASRYGTLWNSLAYAYWNGTTWVKKNVDSGGDDYLGAYTSLALDSADYPRISYFDNGNTALKYAFNDGSGWHPQTVDDDGEVGRYTSLALDGSGNPHISYHDTGNGDLKYAYYAAPPAADFAASPNTGPRPLTVAFTDTSIGFVDA